MPFYEYECSQCKYAAEVLQKISDAPLKKCPSCGKGAFKRLVSAPVFRLKGSGWYETDFKSDKESKRNLAGAEREEAKGEAAKDAKDATTETKAGTGAKPEAKSDAKSDARADARPAAATKAAGKGSAAARTTRRTAARRPAGRARGRKRGG